MVAFVNGFKERYTAGRETRTAGGIIVPTLNKQISANVSASQIKTKIMCARKWHFEKVFGMRSEREQKHFLVGHALHSIAERYLLRQAKSWTDLFPEGWDKGLEDYEVEWMKLMAELAVTKGMWQSSGDVQVVYPLVLLVGKEHTDARGMPLVARASTYFDDKGVRRHKDPICLHDGRPLPPGWNRLPPFVGFIDVAHLTATPAQIEDHKTAKNRKYALTTKKLADDLQVLVYAALPLSLRPELDQVRLKHNVFLKDPEAKTPCYEVTAYANAAMVARKWEEVIRHSEEMVQLRRDFPAVIDPERPMSKGENWHKVPCAIDEGRAKDACGAYGGCPYKDVCFGRAHVEQVAARLAAPDPMVAFRNRQEALAFNIFGMRAKWLAKKAAELPPVPALDLSAPPPDEPEAVEPAKKEKPMPFARPAPIKPYAVHDVVYVPDPDNAAVQYKGSVTNDGAGSGILMLTLWPDVNVEPALLTCGESYQVPEIPAAQVSRTQLPDKQLLGYEHVARSMGSWPPAALAWTPRPAPAKAPAPKPAPVAAPTAAVDTAKVAERVTHDGAFGGGLARRMAAPVTTTAAPAAVVDTIPSPTFAPRVGQILRVSANAGSTFWAALAGKEAIVDDVTMGEHGEMLTVSIANCPYPNVAAGRFELVREPAGPVAGVVYVAEGDKIPAGTIDPTKQQPAADPYAEFRAMIGKTVSVRQLNVALPVNGVLEKVSEHGIEMMGGAFKAHWDKLESVDLFDPAQHQPGYTPPKKTREEKAAEKEQVKAAKAAEKERLRLQKIQDKADLAAKKVIDAETKRAAARAAKKAPPAGDAGQQTLSAADTVIKDTPPVANAAIGPVTLSATPVADALGQLATMAAAAQVPPLFKPQDALPHLDAAITALQQVRSILTRA